MNHPIEHKTGKGKYLGKEEVGGNQAGFDSAGVLVKIVNKTFGTQEA